MKCQLVSIVCSVIGYLLLIYLIGLCSVPFVGGHFDDCSARYTHIHIDNHFPFSSVAEIYFNDSIKVLACRLFSDLDFNSINFPNSWPNITDTCIQQSPDGIAMLYHTTPSG